MSGISVSDDIHNSILIDFKSLENFFYLYNIVFFYGNLLAKGDLLVKTSYLKVDPFRSHYPEWKLYLMSNHGQDSIPCT